MTESAPYRLGRLAGGKARKVKWMWSALTGNESDAIEAEYGVGRDMAAVVREQHPPARDTGLQTALDETGARLAAVVRNKQHRFEIGVVTDDQPTAYALPGGFIFVTRSLTELCERNPDELAFVVAHEMAHVIRRHAINRVLRQTAYAAASMLAPGRGAIAPWLRRVGLDWLERAYSREQEFEADALGGLLTGAAGFDPAGAVRLLERFQHLDGSAPTEGLGAYLSTHPPVGDRISRLRSRLDMSARA
jgi:predicted Zn-dependent protease